MPTYQMSGEGDPHHLDHLTRQRLHSVDPNREATMAGDNRFWIGLFIVMVIFILGMVVGNALHDSMFHALEAGAK